MPASGAGPVGLGAPASGCPSGPGVRGLESIGRRFGTSVELGAGPGTLGAVGGTAAPDVAEPLGVGAELAMLGCTALSDTTGAGACTDALDDCGAVPTGGSLDATAHIATGLKAIAAAMGKTHPGRVRRPFTGAGRAFAGGIGEVTGGAAAGVSVLGALALGRAALSST